MATKQTCFTFGGPNTFKGAKSEHMIELQQTGFDRFTLIYGLSLTTDMTYEKAAAELGACIMHLQSCKQAIDNRTRAEAREAGDTVPYFG